MRTTVFFFFAACAGLLGACAAAVPPELTEARQSCARVSSGPAANLAPAEVRKAEVALGQAEESFKSDPRSYETRDLAYVAGRKARISEVLASIISEQEKAAKANKDYQATQLEIMKQYEQNLNATQEKLLAEQKARIEAEKKFADTRAVSVERLSAEQRARLEAEKRAADAEAASIERVSAEQKARLEAEKRAADAQAASMAQVSAEQKARVAAEKRAADAQAVSMEQLTAEQKARIEAEKRAADAQAASLERVSAEQKARLEAERRAADAHAQLAKLAAVREEPRGTVITLSGSVLFASNKATLLPSAQTRLKQVADVLLTTKERKLVVEGHTDSRGSREYNLVLSKRRAEAVRSYLTSRNYPAGNIIARGIGKARPVADNSSAEGRANNRRVEIIVQH